MAHIRQPRPDSGLGFLAKVLNTSQVIPTSLGSGSIVYRGGEGALGWSSETCMVLGIQPLVKSLRSFCTGLYPHNGVDSTRPLMLD